MKAKRGKLFEQFGNETQCILVMSYDEALEHVSVCFLNNSLLQKSVDRFVRFGRGFGE
jgi:hypothetical protein